MTVALQWQYGHFQYAGRKEELLIPGSQQEKKKERFTHPWQPARLIGWNSVGVEQCDLSAMPSCQGRL